ncbi:MAG: hypothetical protein ACPGNT_06340 [Rhodospirillales bacterium]
MFYTLIATFAAGFVVGGVLLIAFKTLRIQAPKFIVPTAAGLAMILFGIWNEYTWFDRTVDGLPTDIIVVDEIRTESRWQPWTWLFPRVDRFVALDTTKTLRNEQSSRYAMVEAILMDRWDGVIRVYKIIDCETGLQALVDPGLKFDDSGLPANPDWQPLKGADRVRDAICRAG